MAESGVNRKLTAILYADVVDYSRLTGIDEEGTHRTLSAYLDVITKAVEGEGGTVVHFAGDAVLADFPSVVVAMSCALAVQRDLGARNAEIPDDSKLQFRIGINLGDVIVDRNDIYGDGVNIAARLESLADPGGICISDRVFQDVEGKFNCGFEFLGQQQVKNIERPVPTYRVVLDGQSSTRAKSGSKRRRKAAVTAIVAVTAILGGLGVWQTLQMEPAQPEPKQTGLALPDKPSIAVMAFNNLSGDPEQEYFSDGMTEDIITDLSKVSGLFVIARNSSFAYKGRAVNLSDVGRELGVRYILEGSVRKAGGRIRINAQLIDTTTGGHVWAERFDREVADIFTLQDEVTRKIVSALAVKLKPEEQKRLTRKIVIDPAAYDLFLRGLEPLRRFTPETNVEARDFFHQAMITDPRYARAISAIGLTYAMDVFLGADVDTTETLQKAERFVTAAVKLDDTIPQVFFALGGVYTRQKRFDDAVAASRRAIELDTNYADGYAQLAGTLIQAGQPEEGLEAVRKAIRLNPDLPFFYLDLVGRANFMLGRYDDAAKAYAKVVERNPAFLSAHRGLAASYAYLGKMDEAEWQANEVLALQPDFSLEKELLSNPFKRPEDTKRYIEGLRRAGLPE